MGPGKSGEEGIRVRSFEEIIRREKIAPISRARSGTKDLDSGPQDQNAILRCYSKLLVSANLTGLQLAICSGGLSPGLAQPCAFLGTRACARETKTTTCK